MLKTVDRGQTEGEPIAAARAARPAPAPAAVVLGLATLYLVWGSTYLAMHVAVETLPPFLMAGTRFVIAGVIAYGWSRTHGGARPGRREVVDAFVTGGLMLLIGNGAVVWAVQRVPTGMTALVVATMPLWLALIEWLRPGGVRPNGRTMVSCLLGLAGVAWLLIPKADAGGGVPLAGGIVLVLASLSWAAGSLYTRAQTARHAEPFLKTAALQMLAGGSLLLLAGLIHGEAADLDPSRFSGKSVAAMGYLIVAGSLISYTVHGWLMTVVRPTLVATYAFVNPVVAVLLGYALADELLSTDAVLAGGMVVGAVALMVLARPRDP